jgi:hypothetical protein
VLSDAGTKFPAGRTLDHGSPDHEVHAGIPFEGGENHPRGSESGQRDQETTLESPACATSDPGKAVRGKKQQSDNRLRQRNRYSERPFMTHCSGSTSASPRWRPGTLFDRTALNVDLTGRGAIESPINNSDGARADQTTRLRRSGGRNLIALLPRWFPEEALPHRWVTAGKRSQRHPSIGLATTEIPDMGKSG